MREGDIVVFSEPPLDHCGGAWWHDGRPTSGPSDPRRSDRGRARSTLGEPTAENLEVVSVAVTAPAATWPAWPLVQRACPVVTLTVAAATMTLSSAFVLWNSLRLRRSQGQDRSLKA